MKRTLLLALVLTLGVLGALACSNNAEQEQQNEQPAPQVTLEDIVPAPGSALESVIVMSDFEVACDDNTQYAVENGFLLINADDLEGSVEQNIEDLRVLRNDPETIPESAFNLIMGAIGQSLFDAFDLPNKPANTQCQLFNSRFDLHKRLENATWDSEPFKSFVFNGTIVVNADGRMRTTVDLVWEPISP